MRAAPTHGPALPSVHVCANVTPMSHTASGQSRGCEVRSLIQRSLRPCRTLVGAGSSLLLTSLAIGAVAYPANAEVGAIRPQGDPGGSILKELLTIKHAVPKHSPIDGLVATEPHLTDSCTSSTPDVRVDMNFMSHGSLNTVASVVAAHLRALGWSHASKSGPAEWYDTINGKQVLASNSIYRWQRKLPQGSRAGATLQVGIPVTGWTPGMPLVWNLGASSPGVDEPKRQCGSG